MKYHHLVLLCFAFVAIFCTRAAYSDSKVTILNKLDKSVDSMHFSAKKTIELRCITSENGTVTWERGGKSIDSLNDLKDRVEVHKNGNNTLLILKDMKESDVGNYTCAVYNNGARIAYDTVALATPTSAKWGVRVPKNSNVVEGETLSIKCDVKGDLTLEWWYRNTTSGDNYTQFTDRERVKFEDYYDEDRKVNVTNGIIKIEEVDMGDRGEYMCLGLGDSERHNATSMVRVKDKYAALWPFLGICAEVFVLCAIIFIYEKKRNKTELEESDTDQSPDQKNTPDHGKESNLRHRQ